MKTIGTEEHFVTDEVLTVWSRLDPLAREDSRASAPPGEMGDRLREVGDRRIAAMDDAGLDVQVISLTSPGLHNLPAGEATRLQVETNDRIAELVNARPDRFQGFATLATPAPAAAAQELERAVTKLGLNGALVFGRTGERNLDHPDNWPIFEAAASLRAPLYIHPQIPQPPVRAALYTGFDDAIDNAFATHGIGWHYESGVQFLRLALAGVFDQFPDLQVGRPSCSRMNPSGFANSSAVVATNSSLTHGIWTTSASGPLKSSSAESGSFLYCCLKPARSRNGARRAGPDSRRSAPTARSARRERAAPAGQPTRVRAVTDGHPPRVSARHIRRRPRLPGAPHRSYGRADGVVGTTPG